MLLAILLGGCSSLEAINPVTWWHNLEGGPIADQRPPPPNADAPYGKLADAPANAPPTDPTIRSGIADALVADRANAQYAASVEPLSPPPVPAKPRPPRAALASEAPDGSSASLAAASAPPRPVVRAAPAAPVAVAPLPAPDRPAAASGPPATAPLPAVPDTPPAAPVIEGVPTATAPTPLPPTPPAPTPEPAAATATPLAVGEPVSVAFAPGSSALPGSALPGLKLLVRTRGAGVIAITGFGEAKAATAQAQEAAMPLAMARVRAIAAYLLETGVPSSALRIDGEARGAGAIARVLK